MNLIRRLFTLDLRGLALFRMALGLCVLYDALTRIPQFIEHYTDAGTLPVAMVYEMTGRVRGLYLPVWASTSDLQVAGMFGLLFVSAVALIAGYRTRVASVSCWLLIVSLQARNPLVASFGGDTVLRVLLFWSMLLPLGSWYSLDARRRAGSGADSVSSRPTRILSVPAAALLLQMTLLYVTTGFAKHGSTWASGSALYYALHCDYFGNAIGTWLRDQRGLLPPMSFAALWFERYAPILLFVPVWTDVFRMVACVLFIGLHLSLALLMDVGPFPLYTMAAWPAFLPSSLFDRWLPSLVDRWRPSLARRPGSATDDQAGGQTIGQPIWIQLFAAACILFAILHVATTARRWRDPTRKLPSSVALIGKALQLQQNWDMFGPDPPRRDVWPIPIGEYADGSRVDLLSGWTGEISELQKPDDMTAAIGSFRSRLYFRSLYWGEPALPLERLQGAFAAFACRRAVESAADPALLAVDFQVGIETTRDIGPHPVKFERVGRVTCMP